MSTLSNYTFTINCKLHPNLLLLSSGVPCILLGYRFVVFDMADLLDMQNYVISTGTTDLKTDILKLVPEIEKNGEKIIQKYQKLQKVYNPLIRKAIHRI